MAICGACASMVSVTRDFFPLAGKGPSALAQVGCEDLDTCTKTKDWDTDISQGNRALSPDELASIAISRGWLRQPSVAVSPAAMVANAIRMHQSRCSKASPPRKPLLVKYQLAGSTAEAVLEPALHPNAFDGPTRPKGPVWYLSNEIGKAKWRNPFQGITVPKAPPRKPAAPRPKQTKPTRKEREEAAKAARKDKRSAGRESKTASSSAASTPASTPAPDATAPLPRIKLRVTNGDGGTTTGAEDSDSGEPSSRATSQSRATTPMPITPPHPTVGRRRRPHKKANVLDDSSESDSTDSEEEDTVAPLRAPRQRIVLPHAAMAAGTRFPPTPARATMSPFGELFFSPVNTASLPLPAVQQSPFPSHSLDNTIWGARRSADSEQYAFEASSSSDEDADWGTSSGLMVKADEPELPATVQDEDPKLKAATNAMRELFPYQEGSTPIDISALNQLDNHISDNSSAADSSSTATAALYQGKLKSTVCPASLPPWIISSPTSSPNLANRPLPQVETSPIQFLSRTANDIADRSMDMDVDMADNDESWLDESGQLPVHAEDSFSDIDVGSCFGDINSPERDRHLQTAEWARDSALHIKQEPEDCYPSPAATEEAIATPDSSYTVDSRESTISSQSVSSELSELSDVPYELDGDDDSFWLLGPESVKMEELDDWLPSCKADRTVHRGRARASRYDSSRCSGSWGGIGVNNPFVPLAIPAVTSKSGAAPPMVRKRSLRSHSRRTRSTPRKAESRLTPAPTPEVVVIEPSTPAKEEDKVEAIEIEPEIEDDAIGTDELERAREEAEACEKQKREEAEKSREALNACRRAFAAADAAAGSGSVSPDDVSTPAVSTWPDAQPSPWNEVGTMLGSSDDLAGLARSGTLSPLALQHTPAMMVDSFMGVSLDPKALHLQSSPTNAELMMLDNALSQAEIEAASECLPKPAPVSTSPTATKSAPTPVSAPAAPAPAPAAAAPAPAAPAPAQPTPAPTGRSPPRKIAPIAPAPASHPVPIAPKTKEPVKLAAKPASAEKPTIAPQPAKAPAPVAQKPVAPASAPSAPASVKSATPSTASSAVPTRTVLPVNRTATVSPAVSTSSASSGASTGTNSSGNTSTSSGGTTKRLLPGIDACVVDNLPCYSHIWEAPKGGKCTVLRRLDTDFVNGTALLTALGVPPAQQTEHLNAPSPTLASHRAVPLISPQGLHHAPGVPGVWIPLVEARALAKKCGLQEPSLLANILREDLFQLFKKLAGISLRHTSSTESFGMPFVTQPNPRQQGARTQAQLQAQRQAAAAQAAKGPLIRGPGAPPDGCPEPKRRRSVVGTTPVAIPVRPPASSASTSSASSGASTPAGARAPARMVAQSAPASARPVVPVAAKPATPTAAPPMNPTPATKALPATTTTPVVAATPAAQPTTRRTRASVSAK